ncbi:MAG: protein-disulfide reductase DsbD domain-containing protein [Fimbriimonas sp.]
MRRVIWPLLCAVASLSFAQINPPPTVKAKADKLTVAPGGVVKTTLQVTFAPDFHAYQNPPSDKFQIPVEVRKPAAPFKLAKVTYPKGVLKVVAGSDQPSGVYEGLTELPIELTAPAKPGKYKVKLVVAYQQCNEENCYPPSQVEVVVDVTVATKAKKPK